MMGLLNVGAGDTSDASSSFAAGQTLQQQVSDQASVIVQMQAENQVLHAQLYDLQLQAQAHAAVAQKTQLRERY